ncbi:type VI secretion system baseplate subunit TssE [Escherichia coli]|nr:type VI secretion system baseplate subunit TssE [Escherichia coli]MBI0782767.1 type VI secretion system baseplate subunit TssE [Escherichia coli]MBI1030342.1 type VI secretion system baseplate subunit TssE [Escherichia coli]
MPEEKLQTLSLQVINGSELESGRAARCLFTQQGNVGHGPECHWSVQDRQQSIPAQAFTVILHDGTFCLRPQTAQLWLNQAKVTATSDLIQLRQGDEIQIGRLMVRVHLNRGDIPHYDEEMATPETIVTNRDMLTDTLLSTEGAPHYLTEQYISDYTATWRAGMDNLNIRNFESIGQLTGALEQVISGDQPLQRALTVLRDNTQPGVFSEKLSAKEREEALAEPDYQLLTRLGHEFAPENSTLAVQKDKESTMQAVYQQLTELHRYLLAIQNAPVPGKSALKAVQLRLDQNSSDPIFATRQMAKTLPAPLNRWVGRLTDQAWHVVMVEAVHYMEVDWRDSVVKPFNEQLANNYPFNPRSAQDASLDAFERFFKPDGILDTFYQQNLKLFIDNDLSLEDGDNNVIIREDIIAQLETAQKIRDIFFSKQNGLGTSFAVETVSLSGNKRRSVLNLDGQLVDYSQGRNYTAHLVWPNNMREGNESKLTLIGTSGNAPRSISFSGPWAQFRLFGAGQLTGVQDGNFTVRFSVDGGAMTYRVHTDTEDNPFSGGLFSQFGLSDTLY